jgi:hypothetical protein
MAFGGCNLEISSQYRTYQRKEGIIQHIAFHKEKIIQFRMLHVVKNAMGTKDTPHKVVYITSGFVGGCGLGTVDSPYFASLSDKCIGTVSTGVVMHVGEKAGVRKQVPNGRFPRVKREGVRADRTEFLPYMPGPGERIWVLFSSQGLSGDIGYRGE